MSENMIYENDLITVEYEPSEIPWLKVFINRNVREFSECTIDEKAEIFRVLDVTEKLMLSFFNQKIRTSEKSSEERIFSSEERIFNSSVCKINIASFGNMLPRVHWHIMARFEDDSYFPETMWGKKQRESELILPSFDIFFKQLSEAL